PASADLAGFASPLVEADVAKTGCSRQMQSLGSMEIVNLAVGERVSSVGGQPRPCKGHRSRVLFLFEDRKTTASPKSYFDKGDVYPSPAQFWHRSNARRPGA